MRSRRPLVVALAACALLSISTAMVSASGAATGAKTKVPLGLKGVTGLTPAAIARWNRLVQEAKQEGKITIIVSSDQPQALYQAFGAEFGINVTVATGSPQQLAARILAERQQGLHLEDVYVAPDPNSSTELLAAGVFQPFFPNIILNADIDRSTGWYTKQTPWSQADLAHKYITYVSMTPGADLTMFYNTNVITPAVLSHIHSYYDLITPKYRGKWELGNVAAGVAGSSRTLGWAALGKTFWTKFLADGPTIYPVGNDVFAVNALLRGQYDFEFFVGNGSPWHGAVAQGLPIAQMTKILKPQVPAVIGDAFAMFANPPDQAAAQLFANWFLAPEGQGAINQYQTIPGDVSLRNTVPRGTTPAQTWALARRTKAVFIQGNHPGDVTTSLAWWQQQEAKLGIQF